MDLYSISAIINAITSFVIGMLVLLSAKTESRFPFVAFAFTIAGWSLGIYFWQRAITPESALFFIHILMIFAIFIPFFYFHFVLAFIQKIYKHRLPLIVGYIFAIFFAFLSFSPLFISGVEPALQFSFWPNPGPIFIPFLFVWITYVIGTTYLLYTYEQSEKSSTVNKNQTHLILLGMLGGYLGGITNYLLWFDIPIPPFGNILVSVYVILVAYAILKHKLFDLQVLFAQILVGVLWVFVFIQFLFQNEASEITLTVITASLSVIFGGLLVKSVKQSIIRKKNTNDINHRIIDTNRSLETLDKQKTEFVSLASHQLRTPLTAVKGYASLILEGSFGALDQKTKNSMQKIFDRGQSLVQMIEQLLAVSRLEQGRTKYTFNKVNLHALIEEIVKSYEGVATAEKIKINFEVSEKETFEVCADEEKLRSIISNIIKNALERTKGGYVNLLLTINKDALAYRFSVSDTGMGIESEKIERVFSGFTLTSGEQLADPESAQNNAGMSMYIAQKYLDAHSARIWAESAGKDQGATFFIEIPIFTEGEKTQKSARGGNDKI